MITFVTTEGRSDPNLEERNVAFDKIAATREGWLRLARDVAFECALKHHTVTADEARIAFEAKFGTGIWPKVAGLVFHDIRFRPTGSTVRSRTPGSRGRRIMVWSL